jgi:GNAT superfamily N-acetyltransferase
VIGSDVRYFELGARIESFGHARLAWMEGLADLPAGCVVVGADAWRNLADPAKDLAIVEERVRALGGRVRLYLRGRAPALEAPLRRRGYAFREETCLVVRSGIEASRSVTLDPVEDPDAWESKRALHERSPDPPDGHEVDSARKFELERRKVASGHMRAWLIRDAVDGAVAGTVCTLEHGEILRLKNLLVDRERRRRGIGSAAVAALAATAGRMGMKLGIVSLAKAPSSALYLRPEIVPVASWMEWLAPPARSEREGVH